MHFFTILCHRKKKNVQLEWKIYIIGKNSFAFFLSTNIILLEHVVCVIVYTYKERTMPNMLNFPIIICYDYVCYLVDC